MLGVAFPQQIEEQAKSKSQRCQKTEYNKKQWKKKKHRETAYLCKVMLPQGTDSNGEISTEDAN